jgi:hypothetical protein
MKFTNKLGLPESIVTAVKQLTHTPRQVDKSLSVTTMAKGPREHQLTLRHWDELESDVAERMHLLRGIIAHSLVEKFDPEHSEKYLAFPYKGTKISGKVDLISGSKIVDLKTASVWSYVFGAKKSWAIQVNVYKWLAEKRGMKIDKLEIFAWYTDYSPTKAFDKNYPTYESEIYPIPLMTAADVEKYVADRYQAHWDAKDLPDDKLPMCTAEERYERIQTWAVMQKGRKSAISGGVCKSAEDAMRVIATNPEKDLYIEERSGGPKNCMHYCPARFICEFGKNHALNAGEYPKKDKGGEK